jgi:transcriptional regulator with XRE-family HTH domain
MQRGLYQYEVALRAGVERQRYNGIENLHIRPTAAELVRIAKALDVEVQVLQAVAAEELR